jgi:hypothetical protein
MKTSNELAKIKNLVREEVWDILVESNAIIAGGAITSAFCNRDVNDLDVYLRSEQDFITFIDAVYENTSYKLLGTNITERSILFQDTQTRQDVQLIVYKYFPTVQDIFNDYDFTVNMGALECRTEQFTFHDEFFKHNSQRYLQFHTGTAYPIISLLRVQKYIDKGYKISKSQMLRILLTISRLDMNTWDQLKDEIGGMYGLNMDNIFPETEEFSMDKAIEILDEINADSKFKILSGRPTKDEIFKKIVPNYNPYARYHEGIFFKNVLHKDGKYVSQYRNTFEYRVGEYVNGGVNGIYCYEGLDVVDGMYTDYTNNKNVILHLQPELPETVPAMVDIHQQPIKLQLMGNVKVVNVYTYKEFLEKFDTKGINIIPATPKLEVPAPAPKLAVPPQNNGDIFPL